MAKMTKKQADAVAKELAAAFGLKRGSTLDVVESYIAENTDLELDTFELSEEATAFVTGVLEQIDAERTGEGADGGDCFGTYDPNDDQCAVCVLVEECREQTSLGDDLPEQVEDVEPEPEPDPEEEPEPETEEDDDMAPKTKPKPKPKPKTKPKAAAKPKAAPKAKPKAKAPAKPKMSKADAKQQLAAVAKITKVGVKKLTDLDDAGLKAALKPLSWKDRRAAAKAGGVNIKSAEDRLKEDRKALATMQYYNCMIGWHKRVVAAL